MKLIRGSSTVFCLSFKIVNKKTTLASHSGSCLRLNDKSSYFISNFTLFVLLLVEATLKMGDFCKTQRVVVVALVLVALLSIVVTVVVVQHQDSTNRDDVSKDSPLTSLSGVCVRFFCVCVCVNVLVFIQAMYLITISII